MAAPCVSLDPGLPEPARWTLATLVAAAGARVAAGGPRLDLDPGSPELWAAAERGEPPADPLDLAGAFFHLARVEERDAPGDEHGRFPAAASTLAPGAAPVDELVGRVREAIAAAGVTAAPRYPGGGRFAVALTHDIDTPWRFTREGLRGGAARAKAALRERRPRDAAVELAGLASYPWHRVRGTDPNWSFDRMRALERRRGFRSTSFVLAAHRDPHDGAAPEAYAARRSRVVEEVLGGGDEVGLHASYTAGDEPGRLAEELRSLQSLTGGRVAGNRFHYLRLRWHDALPTLDALGLEYDTSLGLAERPGSRAGFSFPFRPWHLPSGRALGFLELPLVLMDATLSEPRYLGLSPAAARGEVDRVLDHLLAVGGCASVLWHNDRFDPIYGRGWGKVYDTLLDGVARRGGWAAPAAEVAAFWREDRCAS